MNKNIAVKVVKFKLQRSHETNSISFLCSQILNELISY